MAGQPLQTPSGENAEQPWRSSLDALEAALHEAARAITELRFSLEEGNPANAGPLAVPDDPDAGEKSERLADLERVSQRLESASAAPSGPIAVPDHPPANEKSGSLTDFQRVWQRLENERNEPSPARAEQDDPNEPGGLTEPSEPSAARAEQDDSNEPGGLIEPSEPRGLDLLPSEYLMTIEARDASVDLITLQRGLLTLAPMENIKLLTYAKGVPVISLRFEGELDLERLSEAVGNATGRHCEVIPQDGIKLFLRLTPIDDQEEEPA